MENAHLLWNKLTKRFASSTFNNQARIWIRFCRITYNGSLQSFISEIRQCLNEVTANTETLGNPNAILNLLHDIALKEEALNLQNTNQSLALNREVFCSKTIHYCKDGKHNPLASHSADRCWQLHPHLQPERQQREPKSNLMIARALMTTTKHTNTCTIVLDTGASNHLFNDIRFFTDLRHGVNMAISMGCDKSTLKASGEGTARLMDKNGKTWSLKNCLYIPDLTTNLVALSQLEKQITIKNEENSSKIFLNNANMPAFTCTTSSGILDTWVMLPRIKSLYTTNEDWHNQLGHMHEEGIRKLILSFKQEKLCEICTMSKFPKLPFQHNFQKTTRPLKNVHLDICGPIQTASIGGAKYFMIINFKEQAGNKLRKRIVNITTDGGGEFLNNNFKRLTDKNGINHIISPPYTPQHNGIAERGNRSIIEKKRCLLLQSRLPPQFWAKAATTGTMLCNLVQRQEKTPYQLWNNQAPAINKLRPFGCRAWVQILEANRKAKLDPVAWEGIFLGYTNHTTAYWVLRMADEAVIISRHVKFDGSVFPAFSMNSTNTSLQFLVFNFSFKSNHWNQDLDADTSDLPSDSATKGEVFHDTLEELPAPRIRVIGPRHPTLISSEIRTNNILPFSRRAHKTNLTKNTLVLNNYKTAIEVKDKKEWVLAINRELLNMEKLGVWSIEDRKENDHPITTPWVFKVKRDHNNEVIEHKARLCMQGFHQIEGLDYLNTFSPTRRISSLRVLISHAAAHGFQFHHMDVKSAFLNAPLDEDLTLKILDGINEDSKTKVLRLHKAIYGLKQAPLAWYNYLSMWLKKTGFVVAVSDPCVFFRRGEKPVWIYVHVDDLAIFGPDLTNFKMEIKKSFDMKDLGEAGLLLGVKIAHKNNGFTLSQEHYINNLAREYELEKYAPVNTPLKPNLQLNVATREEEAAFADLNINYRSAIGALNYISTNTRPDITFAVSHLSRFLEKPGITHWTACLQVLRYLYHTKELSLHYSKGGKEGIVAYADADWGNSVIDRRSTSGYVVTVKGHLISWRTKKQPTVSHSTTEAEYNALSDMTKEIEWLIQLLEEIDVNEANPTPQLFNDNKGAIDLAMSNANHNGFKTKHMDIKYTFFI
ncbi:hypothetical protein O181_011978 [Austropuccinia psidii MF-1]|uniref:Integrase catalytic domain-containing protein n=1 Tax=Austropuccinia psidii MF-1 TaxID=1389203 RepID=A0A9Q3BVW6_9BASI|nr:hypothetical protein [Austropuccinia psidii MF-1]